MLEVVGVDPFGGGVAVGEPAALVAHHQGVTERGVGEADLAPVVEDPALGGEDPFDGGAGPEDLADRVGWEAVAVEGGGRPGADGESVAQQPFFDHGRGPQGQEHLEVGGAVHAEPGEHGRVEVGEVDHREQVGVPAPGAVALRREVIEDESGHPAQALAAPFRGGAELPGGVGPVDDTQRGLEQFRGERVEVGVEDPTTGQRA